MVYLSRIYTKTGDDGTTGLGDGSRADPFAGTALRVDNDIVVKPQPAPVVRATTNNASPMSSRMTADLGTMIGRGMPPWFAGGRFAYLGQNEEVKKRTIAQFDQP